MPDEGRVAALKEILDANPDDAFARYALGLEQALARAERKDEAQSLLQQGIECARRTRNQHALAEMEAMLDELERE